jgi:hypothetical protein
MPFDQSSRQFQRIWKFVDQFSASEEVRRVNLDTALDDIAQGVTDSARIAQIEAQQATIAATAAGAAIFDNTTDGLAATEDDEFFYVVVSTGGVQIYKNSAGTAVLKGFISGPEQELVDVFGLTGVGDETTKLQAMIDYAGANGLGIKWPDGGHFEYSKLTITTSQRWHCDGECTLYSNKTVREGTTFDSDYAIQISGTEGAEIALAADFEAGQRHIDLASVAGVDVGDILLLDSDRLQETNRSGGWTEGQTVKVRSISGTRVFLHDKLTYSGKASTEVTGTVDAITDGWNITLSDAMPGELRDRIVGLTITDGAAAGERRFVTGASANGLDVMHDDSRDAWPGGLSVDDGYSYAWKSTVQVIKPVKVQMDGLRFYRAPVLTATNSDRSFRGLRIKYADMPRVTRCTLENFAETNLHLFGCWHPKLSDIETHGANRVWGTSSGTGYGVSIDRCATPRAVDVFGRGNRRVLDLTGTRGYTTNGQIIRVRGVGGGLSYTGAELWPGGTRQQSVVGSHGSGRFTKYVDCSAEDTWAGVLLRGRAEVVTNFHHVGYADRCITMNHGGGHTVKGLVYDDRFSEVLRGPDERHVISTSPEKRAKNAVFITYADEFVENLQIVLQDIVANSLSDAVVRCDGTGVTVRGLKIHGVNVTCSPEGTGQTSFELVRRNPATPLDDCAFTAINIKAIGDYTDGVRAIDMVGSNNVAENGFIQWENSYIVNIAQGGVVALDTYRNSLVVDMVNYRDPTSRPAGIGISVNNESSAMVFGDQNDIENIATKPTAGTDATAGKVALNLTKSEGKLYIANNSGSTQTFEVRGVL